MQLEEKNTIPNEETDLPVIELDELFDMELSGEEALEDIDVKPSKLKNTAARKSIEQILEERALKKQLSDVFDDDILLD